MENEMFTAEVAGKILDMGVKLRIDTYAEAKHLAKEFQNAGYHVIWSGNAKTGYVFRKRG